MKAICKNCETPHNSSFNYCPQCSQKANLHRINPHEVFHEAVHYFTHADKGIFQLIRDLTLKSGIVAKEYINGKRKKYFPPLNFFLLIAAIFVFISNIPKEVPPIDIQKENQELNSISNPAQKEKMIHLYERKEKMLHFIKKYSNLMAMMALPLTAFFFWLFYRKENYNYTEHLVAGMYMLGFCILINTLLILPISLLFHLSSNYSTVLFLLFQLLYFTVFYYKFLNKNTKLQFAKAFTVSALGIIFWGIVSGFTVNAYISSGFWGIV
ncbi:DUF3667 domain-containing protein [Flavobacterium sp. PL02]|uniref:DUF3667 domain-containing protein n=1 Tax=Flavobacterium sp. PL02 TaxID=3088354 RepID=UPI002B224033|nr:DUF3667 domain-containing protein [Flavobacterium sp. PL02]MEA9415243.1 DUF3667 domain-containing protein [Flavobacterium sp. PL02]